MKTLLAPTEDYIKRDKSTLTENVVAGTDVNITIESNDQMADNTFVVIGREGTEKAELQQINAAVTPGETIRVATLKFDHKAGEPIRVFRFNQRKFYGSLTEDGSYTELILDGSPKNIQVDDPQGTLLEYTGDEGYLYFKATYYNSETLEETESAEAEGVLADESARYASIYGIRKMAGFTENPFITDGRIEEKRLQAENEINSTLINVYTLPFSYIPHTLKYVCELLAAGYLMFEEYEGDTEGVKLLGEARGILKSIVAGKQKLLGLDLVELTVGGTSSHARLVSNPGNDAGRRFSMDQKF